MPPAPSGAVDPAVKDIRDGLRRDRPDKPVPAKDPQQKVQNSEVNDHIKPAQSTSSPPASKARKVKKKKKNQKASQSSSHLEVDGKAALVKAGEKVEGVKSRDKSPMRTPTPPSPQVGSSSSSREASKEKHPSVEPFKMRSDGIASGPRTPPEVALKKSGESNIPTKRKDSVEVDGGKHRGNYHRREKREEKEPLKGSDSGSSGSAGITRNASLALVEKVLQDLPHSRSGRKRDLCGHSDIPTPPVESPREKPTVENGVVKPDVAYGNMHSVIPSVLPKFQKTVTSSCPTKSPLTSNVPMGNGFGEVASGKDYVREAKDLTSEDNDAVMSVAAAASHAVAGSLSQVRVPSARAQIKAPTSSQPPSEQETVGQMHEGEVPTSLASRSPSQPHPQGAQVESMAGLGDGPTTVGAVSVVGCGTTDRKLNTTLLGGIKKVVGLSNGHLYSEGGGIRAVHREQLIFDMNDFDEEEVYIRRNKSGGSLDGSHGCPGTPGPGGSHGETAEGAPPGSEGAGNSVVSDWRYGDGNHLPTSTPQGPINFRFANGLLHARVREEDHGSEGSTSSHQQAPGGGGLSYQSQLPMDVQVVGPAGTVESAENANGNEIRNGIGNEMAVLFTREPHQQNDPSSGMRNDVGISSSSTQSGLGGDSLGANENNTDGRPQINGKEHSSGSQDDREQGRRSGQSDQDEQGMRFASLPGPSNDLDRLLLQATPMLQLDPSARPKDAVESLTLDDVWSFYYEPSMFGREVYIQGGTRGPSCAYFLPYLSAIQIFVPTDDQGGYGSQSDRMYLCDIDYWPKIMRLHFEQFESNPPWYRLPLHDTMNQLAESFSELRTMRLKDLHPASWFCVAWYPLYRIPDAPLATRFLTYHTFHPPLSNINTVYQGGVVPLPVYGLEWYNMRDEPQWMDNISLAKSPRQTGIPMANGGSDSSTAQGTDAEHNWENQAWQMHVRELRTNAKKFARGIGLRKMTRRGIEEANTHHHDFEYFYERN